MPEALATTKRKFNRILDEMANSSSVSLADTSVSSNKRLRQSVSSTSLPSRNASAQSLILKATNASDANKPPNFAPWSQDAFLARLKTFNPVSLWHPKPEALSELHWAKHGWTSVDVNTVACRGGCEKRVVVDLHVMPRRTQDNTADAANPEAADTEDQDADGENEAEETLEQALVVRYKDLMGAGHADNCLWRRQGCKDDIHRLQLIRPSIWLPELQSRYHSLVAIGDDVKNVAIKPTPAEDTTVAIAAKVLQESPPTEGASTSDKPVNTFLQTQALTMALHGWHGAVASRNPLLSCSACFQRIGLWMYQPGYHKSKQRRLSSDADDEDETIDLLEMHREYCPWRNATSQSATGDFKGMHGVQILDIAVARYAKGQKRLSNQNVEEEVNGGSDDGVLVEITKEEAALQDKERESRFQKLKRVFTVKKSKPAAKRAV